MTSRTAVPSLPAFLSILRRRKWYVLVALTLAVASAAAASALQERRYEATAEVLLPGENVGLSPERAVQDPIRLAQTQVRVARVPELARRVLRATGTGGESAQSFLDRSRVVANHEADILEFSVAAPTTGEAERLATAYARAFTEYRADLARAATARGERLLEVQLAELRESGDEQSPAYEQASADLDALQRAALAAPNAVLLRPAANALLVQPRSVRNLLLAAILGLLVGACAAAAAESLDKRVRSTRDVTGALDLPALGRVPNAAGRRSGGRLPVQEAPGTAAAEAFRMLRSNVDLSMRDAGAKTVLVSSAMSTEGKTHVVGNLALAFAQAGRRVVAVDLDLRRPELGSLFGVARKPGLTDVVTGHVALDNALVRVPTANRDATPTLLHASRNDGGELLVLPAGTSVADPGAFVGRRGVAELLLRLGQRSDVVLVDTPPLLQAGDAVSLGDVADGVLVVVRAGMVDGDTLHELDQVLGRIRATTLGFALSGVRSVDLPRPYLAA